LKPWGENLYLKFVPVQGEEGPELILDGLTAGTSVDPYLVERFVARCLPDAVPWATPSESRPLIRIKEGMDRGSIHASRVVLSFKPVKQEPAFPTQGIPRPGTGDLAAYRKWGTNVDLGARSPWGHAYQVLFCAAGGIALQLLEQQGVHLGGHIASIGLVRDHRFDPLQVTPDLLHTLRQKSFPVIQDAQGMQMIQRILREKAAGNSIGGTVELCALGLPEGLGGAWFETLESRLSQLLYALPGIGGVEFGSGFGAGVLNGSQHNDAIALNEDQIVHTSNHAGGVAGGMTTGQPLILRAAVNPSAVIACEQASVDLATGEKVVLIGRVEDENRPRGRHEKPLEPVPERKEIAKGRHESAQDEIDQVPDGYVDVRTGQMVRLVELGQEWEPCSVPAALALVESGLALCLLDLMMGEKKEETLEDMRREIAAVDRDLTALFARRMHTAQKIGLYKRTIGMQVLDAAQEARVYQRVRDALPDDLKDYGCDLYRTLMQLSKQYQMDIKDRNDENQG